MNPMSPRIGVVRSWCVLGCLAVAFAHADDLSSAHADAKSSSSAAIATVPPEGPLRLPVTGAEIQTAIREIYAERHGAPAFTADSPEEVTVATSADGLEEVTVTASEDLLPMRDETQEIPGGVAALLWAFANPTQAWRIFLPIPPK